MIHFSDFNRYTIHADRKILEKNTAEFAVLKIMQKSEIVGFRLQPAWA